MQIDRQIRAEDLASAARNVFEVAQPKIRSIHEQTTATSGAPVFTVAGKYTSRGWTEWTQGFQVGAALLVFDATDDGEFLELGRRATVEAMAPHVTHIGVHDHGFNNVSTYGTLLRLMQEGRLPANAWERNFYEMALKSSGAVQAARWSDSRDGGYLYSFNGPHSLFVDTIRTVRSLAVAHRLGHALMGENDKKISLLGRLIAHCESTARHAVYYSEGRDSYDVRGRVAHESIFNINDGNYRCPNSQQGYSPFSTWTRGLSWAMLGFAEELEFLETIGDDELEPFGGRAAIVASFTKAARATCDFYIENSALDGIPYWDTGAPQLHMLGDWRARPAEPFNRAEPVDSSAAAIGAQGLLRLGRVLKDDRYRQAGLSAARTVFGEPYLSRDPNHQGLLLHSVYHRPNGWDYVPPGQVVPCGEACMWGDYHLLELALYVTREAEVRPYLTFWGQ
jgi:hypothetical protein